MKRALPLLSILTILSLGLGACNLGTAPTESPTTPATTAPTEAIITREIVSATTTTEAPPLDVIDLDQPSMEVGSKFLYVDGTTLVAVPGGPFTMGTDFNDNPERIITVDDFWIYSTKVTNSQYALCVQSGKCSPPATENAPNYGDPTFVNFPVTGVTHAQATDYCTFVKGRLPTEAEWEKTARGPEGNLFPWGNDAPNCDLTNYASCEGKTTAINDYPLGISYYGAWDMGGNVREWAADWYEPLYNVENPVANPPGPALGEERSVRSASFADSANITFAAHRFSSNPQETQPDLGFRCVVEEPFNNFAPWCEMIGYAGTAPDGTQGSCVPEIKCSDVNVSVSENCNPLTNTPYSIAVVSIDDPNLAPPPSYVGAWYNGQFCQLIEDKPNEKKFLCEPDMIGNPALGAKVTGYGSCTDVSNCSPSCPENYTKQGDTCIWNGSSAGSVECLPGSNYDPLTQCCTAIPDIGSDISLCPAGYVIVDNVCVENPDVTPEVMSVPINFATCTPPSKPDDGTCTLNDSACRLQGKKFDPATCTCN